MGNLLVCTGERAKIPYYLNTMGVNVYSIEELCYVIAKNPFLVTKELCDGALLDWIGRDCALPELSARLYEILKRGCQLSDFIGELLSRVGYCTKEERERVDETLVANANLSDFERRINQGDYLLKSGRFEGALREYELLSGEIPPEQKDLRGRLFHKMGYAYACLFMFDVASKYYKRAYEADGNPESGFDYLLSLRLCFPEERYLAFMNEHPEFRELSLLVEEQMNRCLGEFEGSEESRMLSMHALNEGRETASLIRGLKDRYLQMVMG